MEGKQYRNIGRKLCPVLQEKGAPCELTAAGCQELEGLSVKPAANEPSECDLAGIPATPFPPTCKARSQPAEVAESSEQLGCHLVPEQGAAVGEGKLLPSSCASAACSSILTQSQSCSPELSQVSTARGQLPSDQIHKRIFPCRNIMRGQKVQGQEQDRDGLGQKHFDGEELHVWD